MVQHMLEQVGEHVGATAEEVVSRLIVDAGVYHHTQAAVSHNLQQAENMLMYDPAVCKLLLNMIVLLSNALDDL